MCTLVILRRPGHAWPVLIAANRDEMGDRPWKPPARHWPDRDHVIAGQDTLADGTWLGLNDDRLVAGVLNRSGTLGPAAGKRSRGELPLDALDHAEAKVAAEALSHLDTRAYRSFNLVIADAYDAYWISGEGDGARTRVEEIPPGLSLITATDLNDTSGSFRVQRYLPRFRAAAEPDPDTGDWAAWQKLLAAPEISQGGDEKDAMCIRTDYGFQTVSSSLIALPALGPPHENRPDRKPLWLFAPGPPDEAAFDAVDLSAPPSSRTMLPAAAH